MQQYIDISNIVIYQCIAIKCILIYTTDAAVVHYGCEFYLLIAYNFRGSSGN